VNIKEIKEMLNLMNDNNLTELEVEKDGTRIRLKKAAGPGDAQAPIVIERQHIPHPSSGQESAQPAKERVSRTIEIKAPMVGTFYRAPSPETPPYVEVGQIVEAGQVVCIIEAMKLMNEIKSEVRGTLVEVLVDNTEPVEFGQSMFILEPL
jgi:acetyl-CoA carboxylase biotin carboxyl carrier protein